MVLAGEREGGNALAQARGLPSSLLVDLHGAPVLDWTLRAVAASQLERICLVGPGESVSDPLIERWRGRDDVDALEPALGPAASAARGVARVGTPALVTTADHALLLAPRIDDFVRSASARAATAGADVVVGLVPYALVRERFPGSRRTRLRFADLTACGANLFYAHTPRAAALFEFWRLLEALRKTPHRMAGRLGWWTLVRYLTRTLSLDAAFRRISDRAGATVVPLLLDEAELAVDVDSEADLALAGRVLAERDA
ncbi:MAG: NTP transferase domain-containing protein [Pseudomonadota bacterium]